MLAMGCLLSMQAAATVVEVRTVMGDFSINLFDEQTPETVDNFLQYVNSGAYANNVVHRSEPGFVIQAGGYQYNGDIPLDLVPTGVAVTNEPVLSNVRGTIAMAKLNGQPNSATSQWFVNLADNSSALDRNNGGFTVFGQVLGDGMEVIEQIAELSRFNLGSPVSSIPLIDYTGEDAENNVEITGDNLVLINDIVVTDATTVTNPDLDPVPNTLINQPTTPPTTDNGGTSSGSGGAMNPLTLLLSFAGLLWLRRRKY